MKIIILSIKNVFLFWIFSLAIFYYVLFLVGSDLSDSSTFFMIIFLINVSIGSLAFIMLSLDLLRGLFINSRGERITALKYFSATVISLVLFFFSIIGVPGYVKSPLVEFGIIGSESALDEASSLETTPTPVPSVLPTPKPTKQNLPSNTNMPSTQWKKSSDNWEEQWKVEKIDDITTDSRFPADDRMGTPEELFVAINSYRSAHTISQVQKHDTLCRIAQTRANQLFELGELDQHAGMDSLAHSQQDFDNMGEVISGGTQNELAVHTVEWGWGRSQTGHKESVLNPKWTHGCGGVAGLFSVFVFGKH